MRSLSLAGLLCAAVAAVPGSLVATTVRADTIDTTQVIYWTHTPGGVTQRSMWIEFYGDYTPTGILFEGTYSAASVGQTWTETAASDPDFAYAVAALTDRIWAVPSFCAAGGGCIGFQPLIDYHGYRIDAISLTIDSFDFGHSGGWNDPNVAGTLTFIGIAFPVPEPGAAGWLGFGIALAFWRRRGG
jgi:hypothetical protein